MNSPLRFERYFYSRIVCIANPEFDPNAEERSSIVQISNETRIMRHAENERRWQVILDLKTPPAEENVGPYQLDIQVVGFFEVPPDSTQDPEKLVGITGSSMLHSAVRELVLGLSSRGPWPAVFLPAISYQSQPDEVSPKTS